MSTTFHGPRGIFPSETSFRINIPSSRERVLEILKENINDRSSLKSAPPDAPFRGDVYYSDFQAREAAGYKQVLLPVFHGKLEESEGTVVLKITATNIFTALCVLFSWAWAIGLFMAGIRDVLQFAQGFSDVILFFLIAVFFAAIALFMTAFHFKKVENGINIFHSLFVDEQARSGKSKEDTEKIS